jgi:hypothetical protein
MCTVSAIRIQDPDLHYSDACGQDTASSHGLHFVRPAYCLTGSYKWRSQVHIVMLRRGHHRHVAVDTQGIICFVNVDTLVSFITTMNPTSCVTIQGSLSSVPGPGDQIPVIHSFFFPIYSGVTDRSLFSCLVGHTRGSIATPIHCQSYGTVHRSM